MTSSTENLQISLTFLSLYQDLHLCKIISFEHAFEISLPYSLKLPVLILKGTSNGEAFKIDVRCHIQPVNSTRYVIY